MLLSLVATQAVPVQPVGMTASAWVGIAQVVITTLIGGGGLYGIARGVALLWRMWNDSKKLDTDAAAAVRKEMMDLNDRLSTRVGTLESDLRDERKRCDDETAALRKAHAEEMDRLRRTHAEEMRTLHEKIEALHRQMVQMQQSTGRAIRNGLNAPAAASRVSQDAAGIGEALRETFKLPGTGDEL